MYTSTPTKYKNIGIHGPISVEGIDESDNDKIGWGFVILLMGVVGSGQNTFIENLSLNGGTKIKLPRSTQSIIPYRIKNVTWREHAVHIVDVPGFGDAKTSERKIISLLKEWMKNAGTQVFYNIVYFMPITLHRLSGPHKEALNTVGSFAGVGAATNITIVTTMWDVIWGEEFHPMIAERAFNQLRDSALKGFTKAGSELVRFDNTPESALLILDKVASRYSEAAKFHLEDMVIQAQSLQGSETRAFSKGRDSHQSHFEDAAVLTNVKYRSSLIQSLKHVEHELHMPKEEVQDFETLPNHDDMDVAPQVTDASIVAVQILLE